MKQGFAPPPPRIAELQRVIARLQLEVESLRRQLMLANRRSEQPKPISKPTLFREPPLRRSHPEFYVQGGNALLTTAAGRQYFEDRFRAGDNVTKLVQESGFHINTINGFKRAWLEKQPREVRRSYLRLVG